MSAAVATAASPAMGALHGAASAGVLQPFEYHVAGMLVRRAGVTDPDLAIAVALCAKAVRLEHVCLDLDDAGVGLLWRPDDGTDAVDLPAPSATQLRAALERATPFVETVDEGADLDELGTAPVVLSGPRCYLRRYALLEQQLASRLAEARTLEPHEGVEWALLRIAGRVDERQLAAIRRAFSAQVSVIAGGPGTGKTTAIAALYEVARSLPEPCRVALAAPTGKAAARLDEAVRAVLPELDVDAPQRARTIHSLLGIGMGGTRRARRRVDADLLVIDEASMVSLPLLASVLAAVPEPTAVVLVGDPDQLASIEVGAVLADVVLAATRGAGVVVTTLETAHRFHEGAGVAALARAVRDGRVDEVEALVREREELARAAPGDGRDAVVSNVVEHATAVIAAARAGNGDGALALIRALGVLCGTKLGDGSTDWWRRTIEAHLVRRGVLGARDHDYVGRPVLVTRNDPLTGLTNGTTGVVVADGDRRVVHFDLGDVPLDAIPWTETAWALTIHKSQGSEYEEVVVSLPAPDSRVLSRELVYTAVTRARRRVTLVAPPTTLEVALSRRVARASGLVARLQAQQRSSSPR